MMNRINNNNYYFYNKIKTKLEQIHTYKSEGQRHQQKQNKQNKKKTLVVSLNIQKKRNDK